MAAVRFFAPDTDAFVDSVKRHAAEFTARTGIDLDLRIIGSDEYFSNRIGSYLEGPEAADVYMSGPVLLWEHIAAGSVEPLDRFVEQASDEFAPGDFFPSLLACNRWSGRFGDPLGKGSLWEIPVNCETYNLAFFRDALERHRVDPPRSWEEYFRAASLLCRSSPASLRGFAQRGVQVWHTMYTGYATQFWAYGARDFDESGRCAIASPAGVAATTAFLQALRDAGPADWVNQRWYELAMDFCAGRYGLIVDSDHYVAFYEMGERSIVKGRVGYALPPAGPSGRRASNMWTWSLVMNARSRRKPEAWRFIEWAAGRSFLLRSAFEGNMNPTRRSTWEDPSFREAAGKWGDFYAVTRELIEHVAAVLVTPCAAYLGVGDRWVKALRGAYAGDQGVSEALESAAADIDLITAGR